MQPENSSHMAQKILTFLVLLPLTIYWVHASDMSIEYATSTLVEENYVMDAFVEFDFDDEVITALSHGIPITIDIHIKIKRDRDWLWDPIVRDETVSFRLERHALSDHYLLINLQTEQKEQFQYLDEALRELGTLDAHFLFDASTIEDEANYIGYIKAVLDIESLPPPLRPMAYFSGHWRAKSEWYEWSVK